MINWVSTQNYQNYGVDESRLAVNFFGDFVGMGYYI